MGNNRFLLQIPYKDPLKKSLRGLSAAISVGMSHPGDTIPEKQKLQSR